MKLLSSFFIGAFLLACVGPSAAERKDMEIHRGHFNMVILKFHKRIFLIQEEMRKQAQAGKQFPQKLDGDPHLIDNFLQMFLRASDAPFELTDQLPKKYLKQFQLPKEKAKQLEIILSDTKIFVQTNVRDINQYSPTMLDLLGKQVNDAEKILELLKAMHW